MAHRRQGSGASEPIEPDPVSSQDWNRKGNAMNALGKFEEALGCFDKATEIDPKNLTAWKLKAGTLTTAGKASAAAQAIEA